MVEETIYSLHTDKILASLLWQGGSNDCAPYSIATIVKAIKKWELDPGQLARDMNQPVWRGLFPLFRRIPNWATFPWGMVDAFRMQGINSIWGFRGTNERLLNNLRNGDLSLPIIASWKPIWAHTMTLLAYDYIRGWGFANTQTSRKDITWLSSDLFESQWKRTGRLFVEVKSA